MCIFVSEAILMFLQLITEFYSNNRGKDQAHLFLIVRILIAFTASTARRCPSAWVRNTREKPQIFIKVMLPSRITSHLQSIFLKLIHFPLIKHLSGQSHVIYRPIGDNILTRPAGYWRKGFDSPAAVFTRIWRAGDGQGRTLLKLGHRFPCPVESLLWSWRWRNQ